MGGHRVNVLLDPGLSRGINAEEEPLSVTEADAHTHKHQKKYSVQSNKFMANQNK